MKIGVCCSSSGNIDKRYIESSKRILTQIFEKENDLVFGAMNNGIMGAAYKAAKENNRQVIGIAPEIYKDDFKELECDKEILTKDINSRIDKLTENSDILMFMPGGVGTLHELMTAIERKRSKEFNKPIIVCNDTGFFNELLKMLDKVYTQRFTDYGSMRFNYNVANDSRTVIDLVNKYSNMRNAYEKSVKDSDERFVK